MRIAFGRIDARLVVESSAEGGQSHLHSAVVVIHRLNVFSGDVRQERCSWFHSSSRQQSGLSTDSKNVAQSGLRASCTAFPEAAPNTPPTIVRGSRLVV